MSGIDIIATSTQAIVRAVPSTFGNDPIRRSEFVINPLEKNPVSPGWVNLLEFKICILRTNGNDRNNVEIIAFSELKNDPWLPVLVLKTFRAIDANIMRMLKVEVYCSFILQ